MGLPITRIINVSLASVPTGLANYNVNVLAVFTHETPNFIDTYRVYTSATACGADFGTNSLTANMVENMLAQTPNVLSGGGYIVVIPLVNAVSATQGTFETANIVANVDNFKVIDDGEFKITLNGTALNITGLNFTNCDNINDIAEIIQRKLTDVFVETEINSTSGTQQILFTSKKFGTASTIAFSAVSGGTGTSLIGSSYLNTSAGTAVAGANSTGETLETAITRVINEVWFTACATTVDLEDDVIEDNASFIQTLDKMYFVPVMSTEDIAGLVTTISSASQTKTRCILCSTGGEDSKLAVAAAMGRLFSVRFEGTNTAITMQLKSLANVTPDPLFETTAGETIANQCEAAGIDYYTQFGSAQSYVSTGGNDYADNIYDDIWLKLALQVAGFNHLAQTNTKVPQTEVGLDGLKSAYGRVCEQAVINGIAAGGEWNSSETFGDPETFKRNVLEKGYYIYSLPITQQSQADRNVRKAPLIQIAVKRAGAFHSSDVIVVVEN
jgi:hypothetical protein